MADREDIKRVTQEEFLSNSHEVFAHASSRGAVVITDDEGEPDAIISIPKDERPLRFS